MWHSWMKYSRSANALRLLQRIPATTQMVPCRQKFLKHKRTMHHDFEQMIRGRRPGIRFGGHMTGIRFGGGRDPFWLLYNRDMNVSLILSLVLSLPFSFSTNTVRPRFFNGIRIKKESAKLCNVRVVLYLAARMVTEESCWRFQYVEMLVNMIKKCCLGHLLLKSLVWFLIFITQAKWAEARGNKRITEC